MSVALRFKTFHWFLDAIPLSVIQCSGCGIHRACLMLCYVFGGVGEIWLSRRHSVKTINNSSQLRSFVQKSECVDRIWKINLVWKKSLWGKKYFSFCINNGIGCVGDKEPERKIYVLSYPFCGYINLLVLFKIFWGLKLLTINSPPAYDNRKVG